LKFAYFIKHAMKSRHPVSCQVVNFETEPLFLENIFIGRHPRRAISAFTFTLYRVNTQSVFAAWAHKHFNQNAKRFFLL